MRLLRSPYGYLAALAIVLTGWLLGTIVAANAWDAVRSASLQSVTERRADASGQSLAVFTDIRQPDRDVKCRTSAGKNAVTTIPEAKINIVVERQGTEWHLIGLLPRGADGVKVGCRPKKAKPADNATYRFAVVDGFTDSGRTGQVLAMGGLFSAIAVAGATYTTRRADQRKSE